MKENGNGAAAAGNEDWFTVAEAAELLEVNSSRIFDGIRDGKLRVRFRAATPGAGERPLVSSDELCRRARARDGGEPEPAVVEAPAAAVTVEAKVPRAEGSSSAASTPAETAAPAEAAPAPAVEEAVAEDPASETEEEPEPAAEEPSEAPAAAKKKAGKASVRKTSGARSTRGSGSKDLDDARDARRQAEDARRDAEKALDRELQRRRELEDKLEEWSEDREEQQRTKVSLVGQVQDHKRRVGELERELTAARRQIELAEDRIEASLKAVYERDVSVARLESQLEASSQVREAGEEFVNQLQGRLTRVEDRAEEKEREIRRLALGLGEARGEIRLLRPPVDPEARKKDRVWVPWVIAGSIGLLSAWISVALVAAGRSIEAGAVCMVGVLAAFLFGRRGREPRSAG